MGKDSGKRCYGFSGGVRTCLFEYKNLQSLESSQRSLARLVFRNDYKRGKKKEWGGGGII